MKVVKLRTRLLAALIAALVLAGVGTARPASHAERSNLKAWSWGEFGLAQGQTARLNVVNRGSERAFAIDWRVLDSEGSTLAEAAEPHTLPPGNMVSFDVNADELKAVRDRFGRIQVRLEVIAIGNSDIKRNLDGSTEVFDNAIGKTTFTQKFCQNNL